MIDYPSHLSRAAHLLRESAIRRSGDLAARVADLVSFAPGFPDPDLFAWDEFRKITASILSGRDASVLQYGLTRGYMPLLRALPEVLADRGIDARADDVIITTGSQQALDLCARVFIDPGDVVFVELPTYTGAINAFGNAQARLVGVTQDAGGMVVAELDAAFVREHAAGRRVAFVYVIPNFQNPAGTLIALDRRAELLAWAHRRDVLLIEDDPYGSLYFDDVTTAAETRPIKADDGDARVVYMSSFSKTVAPGLRVAWIAAHPEIVRRMEVAKQSTDLCTSSLDQRIIFEFWKQGALTRRLPLLRARYQGRRTVMERALRNVFGPRISWVEPKGGFFLWAQFPEGIDSERLLPRAVAHGVVFVPGAAFFVDRLASRHARLAFSAVSAAQVETGVARLEAAVREELGA